MQVKIPFLMFMSEMKRDLTLKQSNFQVFLCCKISIIYRQLNTCLSNGDSNADFSKPPDFSNLTVSPDLFCYYLM